MTQHTPHKCCVMLRKKEHSHQVYAIGGVLRLCMTKAAHMRAEGLSKMYSSKKEDRSPLPLFTDVHETNKNETDGAWRFVPVTKTTT